MKYGRIFIAILYFVIFSIIASIAYRFAYLNASIDNYYLQHISIFIPTLIFFIYLLRIKNNNLYWSILFLAISVNTAIIIILNIISRIMLKEIYPIDISKIFVWVFGIACVIGFITLYFRSKYKSITK